MQMLITDDFVFLHFPKTGGTFVRSIIKRLYPPSAIVYLDESRFGKHGGVEDIPESYRDRTILSIVRNPFDHLISYYEFEWWKKYPEDTFDFEKMVQAYPTFPAITFDEFVRSFYDWKMLNKSTASGDMDQMLAAQDIGGLTLEYIRMYSPSRRDTFHNIKNFDAANMAEMTKSIVFIKTCSLNSDLHRFLGGLGLKKRELEFIRTSPKIFPPVGSRKRDQTKAWQEYYTSELKDLVRMKEGIIFDVFPEFDV